MSSKRPFHDQEEGEGSKALVRLPKRTRPWNLRYGEVTQQPLLAGDYLESVLRRVVREEIQKAILNSPYVIPRPPIYKIQDVARFQLHFKNKMPSTLFMDRRIIAEDKQRVQLVIRDAKSNEITTGPLSSLMIKIVALRGDFGGDGQTEWDKDDFDSCIVSARDGRRPLLAGKLSFRMKNGVGFLNDAKFTDISRWTRRGKFRLGAFVSDGKFTRGRVQEAVTEAFKVKDSRVESNQKDHPPLLDDAVCCLKKIKKDGAFYKKLVDYGITTVQEFLRSYIMDPGKLRSLLGSGMSEKIWGETTKHALQCPRGNKHYVYCNAGMEFLVFNSIFELVGATIDGLYHSLDELSASQKSILNDFKELAYKNPRDIIELSDTLDDNLPRSLPLINGTSIPGSSLSDPHNSNRQVTFHGFQHLPYATLDELPSDIFLPISNPLHQSIQKDSFEVSDDTHCSLSIPGSSSSQIPNVQATAYDEAGAQMNSKVLSTGQGTIVVQRSASFSTKCFSPENIFDDLLQFQIDDFMPLLQAIGEASSAPLYSRMFKKIITVVKCLAIIKQPVAQRARILHSSGVNGTNPFM